MSIINCSCSCFPCYNLIEQFHQTANSHHCYLKVQASFYQVGNFLEHRFEKLKFTNSSGSFCFCDQTGLSRRSLTCFFWMILIALNSRLIHLLFHLNLWWKNSKCCKIKRWLKYVWWKLTEWFGYLLAIDISCEIL